MGLPITIGIQLLISGHLFWSAYFPLFFLRLDIIKASFDYGVDVYEKKFGVESGKYLYDLSVLKNNGIIARQPNLVRIWDQARRAVLQARVEIWIMDDPQPKRF
jgi:hypothetical protein